MNRHVIFILLAFGLALSREVMTAQISYGGQPASFSLKEKAAAVVPVVQMEHVSNQQLMKAEPKNGLRLKPYKFAHTFNVDVTPKNSGTWTVASDGTKIWRVKILSPGAYSLNIIFDQFELPDHAKLFIYSPDHQKVMGAFTANNESGYGTFAVRPLAGDEMVVEYDEPADAEFSGQLRITKVNHDYKNAFGDRPLGQAGLCNVDVYCTQAEKDYIATQKQSEVRLIITGNELCSGTMVNNVAKDNTPYLITAGHCITSATDAEQTVFYFNYESPDCGQNLGSIDGYVDQTVSGSILRARSDSLDFALVEMQTMPPANYRPYFSGWNNSALPPSRTFVIHHPNGDVKKISRDYNAPGVGSFSTKYISNAFWLIHRWDVGTTEAGSSGSGLIIDNTDHQLIGTLTGGAATCADPVNDYFAMLNKQWSYYSADTMQLAVWLDPSGGSTFVNGWDPYGTDPNRCELFSNVQYGEKYVKQKLSDNSGYITGKNSLGITAYAEKFDQSTQAELQAVAIAFSQAATSPISLGRYFNLNVYDADPTTGLPNNIIATQSVAISSLQDSSMNYIPLTNPITTTGTFYVGYDLDYNNIQDSIAVFNAPARDAVTNGVNTAYAFYNGAWVPFSQISSIGINTSLLIKAHACSVLGLDVVDTNLHDKQFEVYYPTGGLNNYVYLQNNGPEGNAVVSIMDMMGRTLHQEVRYLTNEPVKVSIGNHNSGIYFIAVKTDKVREVMKVRLRTGR